MKLTIQQCNDIAKAMDSGVTFELVKGWVYLSWDFGYGAQRRRWDAKGGSHYPSWYRRHANWGGTQTTVFDQMVRAVLGKSIVPFSSWRYWVKGAPELCSGRGDELLEAVTKTGWPETVPCVLCGKQINGVGDWWGVEKGKKRAYGPACSMRDCRKANNEVKDAIDQGTMEEVGREYRDGKEGTGEDSEVDQSADDSDGTDAG